MSEQKVNWRMSIGMSALVLTLAGAGGAFILGIFIYMLVRAAGCG